MIIVARGGGSLADLFAFCDETLCRTVALLRMPVISSVGHHTDRTLLDDVAAVACSTPTHAAETAVPIDCASARRALAASAARLERQGRRAVLERARTLARLVPRARPSRRPSPHPPAPAAARAARGHPPRDRRGREDHFSPRRAARPQVRRGRRRHRPLDPARARGRRDAGPHGRRRPGAPPPRPGALERDARRPRPAAHAGTRLRADRGPVRRADHERRRRARAARADDPPARRPRGGPTPPRTDEHDDCSSRRPRSSPASCRDELLDRAGGGTSGARSGSPGRRCRRR